MEKERNGKEKKKRQRQKRKVKGKEKRGKVNLQLLANKYRKLYKDPSFQGCCLGGHIIETGTYRKGHKDEILSEPDKNRRATPVENGGIKFIQAVPISRKSHVLKARIRSSVTHPNSVSS